MQNNLSEIYFNKDLFYQPIKKEEYKCSSECHFTLLNAQQDIEIYLDESNKERIFQILHRKADVGEIIKIVNFIDSDNFKEESLNKLYKVDGLISEDRETYSKPCVIIDNECVYDYQYVVLKEINNN